MKKKQKKPKPRNPFVQHLVKKRQGAHEKPYKALRRAIKQQIDRIHEWLCSINQQRMTT